ncbi:GntR family transcriptional regulator [Oceaniovalibus sp. ACAM 378]|uniref:GntR family transcriptional regulator n=1 Tax=Oceaniovalibus sp. ACAM 378 TaxID=2599923 RepID=UPI0011D474E8|nr:GntR family transcriptional regulator [Oceaniovalibus sp. ACAM 378]TYB89473.1 GntR family transcriptional regulator [Oceaniovalibus sp. ACAM 378]
MSVPSPIIEPRHGQRSAFVTEHVRDLIVSGELKPGSRINERILVEKLNISRTPLREAFKVLEGEGLVSIRPNVGATVVALTLEAVEDSIEILIGLESIGAERAARRATPEAIEEITQLHERMVEAFQSHELMSYFHLNQEIHQKIIDAAQNAALSRVYAGESARIRRFRFAGNNDLNRWDRAVREHEQILDALVRREGPLLREILRAHHLSGWRAARLALEQTPSGEP